MITFLKDCIEIIFNYDTGKTVNLIILLISYRELLKSFVMIIDFIKNG